MFTWFKVHYSNPRLDIEVWKSYKRDKKRDISRAPRISSLSLLCLSFPSDEGKRQNKARGARKTMWSEMEKELVSRQLCHLPPIYRFLVWEVPREIDSVKSLIFQKSRPSSLSQFNTCVGINRD